MNHVHSVFTFLLLLLNSQAIKFINTSALTDNRANRNDSFHDRNSGKQVVIGELRETALLEQSDRVSWKFLEEAVFYNSFNEEILAATKHLERLGVRIYTVDRSMKIFFHYKRSLTVEDELLIPDETSFHEVYPPSFLTGDSQNDSRNVLKSHIRMPENLLESILMESVENNQLIRATLILSSRPEVAAQLSEKFYVNNIFVPYHDLKGIHKHLIMENNPEMLMGMFLSIFSRTGGSALLIQVLNELLVDVKISNEVIQIAFDTLLKSEMFLASMRGENSIDFFAVLSAFVSSQRPLIFVDEILNAIIFGGVGHEKERLSVLKSVLIPTSKLDEIVLTCFEATENSAVLFSHLTNDKRIAAKLSKDFFVKVFIPRVLESNDLERIKPVLSGHFIEKFSNIGRSGNLLTEAIKTVRWDVLEFLLELCIPKNGLPLFGKPYVTLAAVEAIKFGFNEIFIRLLEFRYVSFNNTIIINGNSMSLLAVAFRFKNYNLIKSPKMRTFINWDKCRDVWDFAVDPEAQELLRNLGAPTLNNYRTMSSLSPDSTSTTASIQSPMSLEVFHSGSSLPISPNPVASKRFLNEISPNNEPWTHEMKKYRVSDPMNFYEEALKYYGDIDVLKTLKSMNNAEFVNIQRVRGCNAMVWELYESELFESLKYFLGKVTEQQEIMEILHSAVQKGSEFVIRYYFERPGSNLRYTDRIGDRNIVAHLLKKKQVNLAFKLIAETDFNIRHSDSPEVNPEGDILLSATWNVEVMERLLQMGASPNVKYHDIKTKTNVPLLEWAKARGKMNIFNLLSSYM